MTEKQLKRLKSTVCNARVKLVLEDREYSKELRVELFNVEKALNKVIAGKIEVKAEEVIDKMEQYDKQMKEYWEKPITINTYADEEMANNR